MPITNSAQKALRQSEKRRERNLQKRTQLKKLMKSMQKLKKEEAAKNLPAAFKLIDKAAKTGIIKKNTAARRKALLSRMIKKS